MSSPIDQLVAWWRTNSEGLNPGATVADLDRFEEEYGICLTAGFRQLYQLCDGMPDFATDDNMLSLWSLQRIRNEGGARWRADFEGFYISFADAMISAPQFALRIPRAGGESIVATWDFELSSHELVAHSMDEFAAKHMAGKLPGALY